MAELLIVSMLESYTDTKPFTVWPRHVTLMSWFKAATDTTIEVLKTAAKNANRLHGRIGDEALFGPSSSTLVQTVVDADSIVQFHDLLCAHLYNAGIDIEGRYSGQNYRPHVTVKHGQKLPKGSFLVVEKMQLVESLAQGYRRIISECVLGRVTDGV